MKDGNICFPDDGWYENEEKIPGKCHTYCLTCVGEDIDECLTCDTSLHYVRSNPDVPSSECIPEEGYTRNPKPEEEALKCHYSCKKCVGTGSHECIGECEADRVSPTDVDENHVCLCKNKEFDDEETESCSKCHYSCPTCDGPKEDECTDCDTDVTFRTE